MTHNYKESSINSQNSKILKEQIIELLNDKDKLQELSACIDKTKTEEFISKNRELLQSIKTSKRGD